MLLIEWQVLGNQLVSGKGKTSRSARRGKHHFRYMRANGRFENMSRTNDIDLQEVGRRHATGTGDTG